MDEKAQPENTWRFHAGQDERWRWQQLNELGQVIEQSVIGFRSYEECVADAESRGYVFHLAAAGARSETLTRKI
jgi:hypothetical protein